MSLVSGKHYSTEFTSRKNIIINGNFDVWQRGTTDSNTVDENAIRVTDRFFFGHGSAARMTVSQSTDVPTYAESNMESTYSHHIDFTTADTSIGIAEYLTFEQNIEGYNFKKLQGDNVTLSFWIKATKTGTYCIAFRNTGGDRSYVSEYTVDVTDTWEKKIITVPLNESTGTWNDTDGTGLNVMWTIASGTNYHTTAGAWQTGNYIATSNQVNGGDSIANNFQIAQVQLEAGTEATDMEKRFYSEELALCQRYYVKFTGGQPFSFYSSGAGTYRAYLERYPVTLRANPTLVLDVTGIAGTASAVDSENPRVHGFGYKFTTTAAGLAVANLGAYSADAEL